MDKDIHQNKPVEISEFDIAVIGFACRFPGAVNHTEFWQNLKNGKESITKFSDEEMINDGVDKKFIQDENYVKASPVIENPGYFDEQFFRYTPLEAKLMDPQHRILLECAYESLEHAGYDPERIDGAVGVYTGSAMNTYFMHGNLKSKFTDEYIPTLINNDKDFLSTKISYKLNLRGPSLNIQTACSTSLVAIHLACQSLLSHESDMALAGAISVKAPHKAGYICEGGGIVSPDGCVRAFDAGANGTVFGSGGGIVVLKRLQEAIEDSDTIHAVIKGSAINNDGSSKVGYTAPSVTSQANALIEALANSGINAEELSYIETHGTGTPVGDPIEVAALTKAFNTFTDKKNFCGIGSVKSNIGHLDAAAGIAGFIKTVLALKNKQLPPSINYSEPNPEINFPTTPFFVNEKLNFWETNSIRNTAVMSTGMGGTNAAIILQEAPEETLQQTKLKPQLLLLSAKSKSALEKQTANIHSFIKNEEKLNLDELAYTLQCGRGEFSYRQFLVCNDKDEALKILENINPKLLISANYDDSASNKIGFLLSGIGDHFVGMGYDLYKNIDFFKSCVHRCADILRSYLDVNIVDILYPKKVREKNSTNSEAIDMKKMLGLTNDEPDEEAKLLDKTIYAQPALFTIEYALTSLWMHWGVKPDLIVGHSMGEYVAACISGVITLDDALKIIALRAKFVNGLPEASMIAVTQTENELLKFLPEDLSISLINGPKLCVVAGPVESVKKFESILVEKEILFRYIKNAHAFHSKMLSPIESKFMEELRSIKFSKPTIPFISNVSGTWIKEDEAVDPAYWVRHLVSTARFSDALNSMWQKDVNTLVEVGPGKTLSVLAMQHFPKANKNNPELAWSLRYEYENFNDYKFILQSIGKLWLAGYQIKWKNVHSNNSIKRIPLPTYPFERKNFWYSTGDKADDVKEKIIVKTAKQSLTEDEINEQDINAVTDRLLNSEKFKKLLPNLIRTIINVKQNNFDKQDSDNLLYDVEWIKKTKEQKSIKPFNESSFRSVYSVLEKTFDDERLKDYNTIAKEFDQLSVIYIVKAFQQLGFTFTIEKEFSINEFVKKYSITSDQTSFLKRLLYILSEVKILSHADDDWIVINMPPEENLPNDYEKRLLKEYPFAEIEINLLRRSGELLAGILTGKNSALEILFPSGDLGEATKFYQDSLSFFTMNSLLGNALRMVMELFASKEKIKILEIGAGTGGTTNTILQKINNKNIEYVFTDVSNIFLNNAKEKFRDKDFIEYKILDIGADPIKQGFKENSFDIVIAANSLHATESIDATIKNVKKLLISGGIILTLEGTEKQYWFDLFSGGLDGWMMFKDFDLRKNHPLLSFPKWKKVLTENNFTAVHSLDPSTLQDRGIFGQEIIIAQNHISEENNLNFENNNVLIFADDQGLGNIISEKINKNGGQTILVHKGNKYEKKSESNFIIAPGSENDFNNLFEEINFAGFTKKIIHLWAIDSENVYSINNNSFETSEIYGCGSLLNIFKNIKIENDSIQHELFVVTDSAQHVAGFNDFAGITQSSVWGFCKSASMEMNEIKIKRIDIEGKNLNKNSDRIISEFFNRDNEDQIAYRNSNRFVQRLRRSIKIDETKSSQEIIFDKKNKYIITGGMGRLGLELLKWMFDNGARNFVLIDRVDIPDRKKWNENELPSLVWKKIETILNLEQSGAVIEIYNADICDYKSLKKIIAQQKESANTLKGIIHTAGLYQYTPLKEINQEVLSNLLKPKVEGTWNLHQLTKDIKLDLFVCFSSASSIWGAKGQAHYSAANRFLDAFAHFRKSLNLPCLTINWGLFPNTGLVSEEYHNWLKSIGLKEIEIDKAFNLMMQLINRDHIQSLAAKINWKKFIKIFEAVEQDILFEELRKEFTYDKKENTKTKITVEENENNDLLKKSIKEEIAIMLGTEESELDEDVSLNLLGIDSLMSVGLRNKIKGKSGIDIPIIKFMDGSNIADLVNEFSEQNQKSENEIVVGNI